MTTQPSSITVSREKAEKNLEEKKRNLEYEEMQYRICCEHPTDNAMFYSGMEKHRQRINAMREDIKDLQTQLDNHLLPQDSHE